MKNQIISMNDIIPTKLIALSKLKANPSNPRIIKDSRFKLLVESIKSFPEMLKFRPIIVDENYVVLGGNMRMRACKEAGLKRVPVLNASELSKEKQDELIIKDNVSFGQFDWDIIANEWPDKSLEWGMILPFDTTESDIDSIDDMKNKSSNETNCSKCGKPLNDG